MSIARIRIENARGGGHRRRVRVLWLVIACAGLLALGHDSAAPGATDPLVGLKTGHWVQLEGALQGDSTASCDELRILTGDFMDDDWSVRGYAQTIDTSKDEIVIGGIRTQVTETTGFDSPRPDFRKLADINTGVLLEVEGTYLKHRRFIAHEVDDESDENVRPPWPRNRIRIVAKVERVDSRRRLVTVMSYVFQLTDKTRIRSVIE